MDTTSKSLGLSTEKPGRTRTSVLTYHYAAPTKLPAPVPVAVKKAA
jgi:hypothetical protein